MKITKITSGIDILKITAWTLLSIYANTYRFLLNFNRFVDEVRVQESLIGGRSQELNLPGTAGSPNWI